MATKKPQNGKIMVELLQSMASPKRGWRIGELYECATAEEAARMCERGIAKLVKEPRETLTTV